MSKTKKVNTLISLKDEVKEELREDIIMSKLKPGDRIVLIEFQQTDGANPMILKEPSSI